MKTRRWTALAVSAALLLPAGAAAEDSESTLGWQPTLLVQLAVSDLDRSVEFYRDVLELEMDLRNDALQWAKFRTGIPGVTIGLGVQESAPGSGGVSMNIGVDDVEDARALLEERGVEFLGDTVLIPGVVVLADFADPDGNRIRLAGHPSTYGDGNEKE